MNKPKPIKPKKRRGADASLDIPNIPDAAAAAAFLGRLMSIVRRRPAKITLRFVTGSIMGPETALSAYEILENSRIPSVHAEAISSVIGPALILFLIASSRSMRRTGCLFLPLPHRRNRTRELLRDGESWKDDPDDPESDPHAWIKQVEALNWESIRRIVERRIVWADVTLSPMSFELAKDFGLLGCDHEDRSISQCLGGLPHVAKGESRFRLPPRR